SAGVRTRSLRQAAAAGDARNHSEDHDPEQEESGIGRARIPREPSGNRRRPGAHPRLFDAGVDDREPLPRRGIGLGSPLQPRESAMAMVEKKVPYEVNGRPFEGKLIYDDSVKAKRPAVYMQLDWKGIDKDTTGQAREVAGSDYVVLMAEQFGKGYGDKPKDQDQLRTGMLAVHKDRPFTLACGEAAFETMRDEADKLGLIDPAKAIAIGYCAGGGYALELARAGAPFKAVVVFHVTNPNP